MLRKSRYKNRLWLYVDQCSYIFMYSWLFLLSSFCASYISTTGDNILHKMINFIIKGPISALMCILLSPLGILGIILWICLCVCTSGDSAPYSFWEKRQPTVKDNQIVFTIATANLCLLPDFLSKFNNNSFTYSRALKIARRIVGFDELVKKTKTKERENGCRDDSIAAEFPELDFICLQEVWERISAWLLIAIFQSWFSFFVYDVGNYQWKANMFCLGSGLMFASRFPISDVNFKSFRVKTLQGIFVSLGLLQVKVVLGNHQNEKKVGYIATTHLQSYQGKTPCLLAELDESLQWIWDFREETIKPDEEIVFDIVCGDFNFDNMSPGDRSCSEHEMFDNYVDPCRVKVGEDYSWAIGTEMRQLTLWDNCIDSPEKFKKCLQDPTFRRCYLLDADVQIQTIRLAFSKVPRAINGTIPFSPVGGRRRIDYILYNKKYPLRILRYKFITALNQLTDHIPVVMTFQLHE